MQIFSFMYDAAELILSGLPIVLLLTLASFFPALALGIVGGLLASSKFKVLRMVVGVYVYVFRSTPFLMFTFLIYYGLPQYDIDIGPVATAIVALSLCHGAYMTEIVRGGLLGFDRGQNEAAIALGFGLFQRLRDVVLPQTLMAIIPSLVGQAILIVKDTSLVSVVGISELTRLGREVVIRTNEPFIIFTIVAAAYFAMCFGLEILARNLEARVRRIMVG
ncbi:amino acid ABC transporter permease [Sinorhizobium meliloti]|uniref:amino acid ABC transporter permease n=1 Tax=Rhizobium meliloti TaxID=382 RepID=UPI000FD2775E|nr:amino acid ABC transporter permease [Sinorhizobium meliloti]RVO43550.1 amino acid ABC transporter permease [Sinorhizobium meliloti]